MGNPWSPRERQILKTMIARHGIDEGCFKASLMLSRSQTACKAQHYYSVKNYNSSNFSKKLVRFFTENNETYGIYKVVGPK